MATKMSKLRHYDHNVKLVSFPFLNHAMSHNRFLYSVNDIKNSYNGDNLHTYTGTCTCPHMHYSRYSKEHDD